MQRMIDKINHTKTKLIGLPPNEAIKLHKPISQYTKEHPNLPLKIKALAFTFRAQRAMVENDSCLFTL